MRSQRFLRQTARSTPADRKCSAGSTALIGLDQRLEHALATHRTGLLDPLAEALSWIGTGGAVWLALACVFALLWRRPSLLFWVGAADLIAYLASEGLKQVIERRRPSQLFPGIKTLVPLPYSSSFPSGHATTSFACAVVLASAARTRRTRVLLLALATLIALSRLYVGVHFPLDVVAGAAFGAAIGLTLAALANKSLNLFGRFDQARGDDAERGQ